MVRQILATGECCSMKNKIILDLCGGTGSWSKPYKDAGYEVVNVTLPEFDVRKTQIKDGMILFPGEQTLYGIPFFVKVPIKDVYGILAAPPCTMFSRARTTAKTPRDFAGAMEIVQACLEIIWACRSADTGYCKGRRLKFWALENPMGYLRQFLGKPGFSFQPWEYGDMHFKRTDVWGYFNIPKATHNTRPEKFNREEWAKPTKPDEYKHMKLNRAAIRAITPKGFARAFYKANK